MSALSNETTKKEIAKPSAYIVGGGLAGLLAAIELSEKGVQATILEGATEFGGRARTREVHGFLFNRGPHALYCDGAFKRELDRFGIPYTGGRSLSGSRLAIARGKLYTLPTTIGGIFKTSLFSIRDKIHYARVFKAIMSGATNSGSFSDWLDEQGVSPMVRSAIEAVGRISSYANGSSDISAQALLDQIRMTTGGTMYVDGGWISLVNALSDAARSKGVVLNSRARVQKVHCTEQGLQLVLNNGDSLAADAVILALGPQEAAALAPDVTSLSEEAQEVRAVRASTLDLGLKHMPRRAHDFALGIDTPFYLSVHSESAKLAPDGGALVHIAKYLPIDSSPSANDIVELEAVADLVMPGWRELEVSRHILRGMVVSNGLPRWDRPRPAVRVADAPGLFLTGDWVGEEGMIADAAAASAIKAAQSAFAWLSR